jgi:hypothetical protein
MIWIDSQTGCHHIEFDVHFLGDRRTSGLLTTARLQPDGRALLPAAEMNGKSGPRSSPGVNRIGRRLINIVDRPATSVWHS